MRRSVLLGSLLLLLLAGFVVAAAGVPDARLVVSDAEPRQGTIAADAPATIDVTVDLAAGSDSAVTLDRVVLRDEDGTELGSASELGALGPGNSLTVPVTVTFEDPGHRELRVVAEATDEENASVNATRPVSLVVEGAGPLVDVDPVEEVVGVGTTLNLSVRNPSADQLRNVTVTVEGEGTEVRTDGRSIATLGSGETAERAFEIVPQTPGARPLEVTIRYATAEGSAGAVERTTTYEAVEPVTDVGVRVAPISASADGTDAAAGDSLVPGGIGGILGGQVQGGGQDDEEPEREDAIRVSVTNFGNAPAERVVVTPQVGNETLPRLSVDGPLEPGESDSVRIDLSRFGPAEVTVDVAYETAGRTATTSTRYDYRIEAADVTLTGVDLEAIGDEGDRPGARSPDAVRLSGNLGNPTGQRVTGVVVSVVPSEHVEPAYPRRDYFVGTLEPGEFAPFDVTAAVDGPNATAVQVDVAFRSGGEVETRTFELPYDDAYVSPQPDGDGGSTAVIVAIPAFALLFVGTLAILYLRRS
ncbi:MAG: hypothetical protein V5A46_01205 [Haloferacaceae archaeon]